MKENFEVSLISMANIVFISSRSNCDIESDNDHDTDIFHTKTLQKCKYTPCSSCILKRQIYEQLDDM